MEKARTGIVDNSESSSTVSSVNRIDIDELSKEKEEELLFCEEEGDDEDTLSDDSLRLRLSDEEDAEQDTTVNDTNITKLKSQSRTIEQPILDTIVEETLSSDLQQTVEKVSKPDIEKSTQEIYNTAVKIPGKSTLDEYISENKQIQDSIYNLENTRATVNESSEKCTFTSSKDLKIIDIKNECSSITAEQHITSKNDNLSIINNCTQTGNLRNAGLTIHNEKNLKETASDNKETITTNTCELNKLDNVDSNKSSVDSNIKIYNGEKSSTTISNSNDDNLKDKIIEKHIKNDNQSSKCSYAESNVTSDYMDLKSGNSNDNNNSSSHKDIIAHKNKNNNLESVDITESKNTSKITEKVTNISLTQNQNNLSNIKDNAEVRNKDSDTNDKSVIETVNNPLGQTLLLTLNDVNDSDNDNGTKNVDTVIPRRKRIKKIVDTVQDHAEEIQEEKESRREKRKTARNAEEIIKKKYLNSDSDSNDNTEQLVTINNKLNQDIIPVPPLVAIKRNCSESEVFNGIKKAKMNINSEEKKDVTQLSFIEKFFRRDIREKLPKLTQEELEELLIQKIVETIAMRSEIGQLREQARISEKYQEITRTRMEQLMKQVKDFETVLHRNESDRRANPNKSIAPIKINRSVGLQVNFITEHGIQNLRQTANLKSAVNIVNNNSSPSSAETNNNSSSPRRGGIKVRSPRPVVTMPTPVMTQSTAQTAPLISTVTPAALVVAKPLESQHTLTLSNQPTNMKPILTTSQQQIQSQSQAIVLNGKISQLNRPIAPKPRNNDLIDLTDEEEKNKSNAKVTVTTTPIIEQPLNVTSKSAQSFPRVLQTIPANVAITTQPTSIKVITTNQQPAPTALVNNVNPPRLAYVMQSSTGSPRQVLIASNPNQQVQIRPVMNTPNRPPFSTVTYKGISTITNGTVRVLTTPVLSNVQISKHPAPLPDIPNYAPTPGWKLPPPAPSLKISKVSNGIVLSWNMSLSDKYADIASYQLYAYQEVAGVNPNTSLWKKVGDVRALPLPMACTLTQFSEGNNYYFAVRAVDTHSRKGQYSMPGNISL
ncbi:PREDICTED: activating transcription factor 7-interacting protein 1 isoform X1 [Acromyrmex echinatior]|uniref:Activating transcription factor 7-interacting protein 1 n=1 Tax=Acromyrmex echinatior TaxID=103372 RepID=F4W3Z1_ACREC|nr:PREDICTED: activating transcription factor 7-interacting protein 1 isoform X1 [Acromyrmex echinatior]XP_011061562.1 PREDICTED: activating transcription factor 7-interacting protein 1 isoform X1 [Acromyrmex echinatior]XP_011061646.1 PREDICTED: activating transcription factor 7-interacting protein 1 isoform X1 [Acromyrmex echinatior]EGI70987.1 Activating transcription factor 7-interacting protein 1 [Acromyrmex echinatior]